MKKYKKRKKRKIRLFFIIILIISIVIYKELINKDSFKNTKYEYQNTIKNESNVEINDEIEKLIINYFNTYYRSMMELKAYDMTKYFDKNDSADALLNQTALEILISSRKKQLNDLSLSKAKYDIVFTKINNKDNTTHIELKENSYIDFSFMNSTSKIYNVLNTFDIVKINNEYKVKSFYKEQGQYIMVEQLLDKYNYNYNDIKEYYNQIFDEKLELQKKEYEEYLNNQNKSFKKCDNNYDRNKALVYAKEYVIKRNHTDYGIYGGNCQNYSSWTLNEGGIPMDIVGTYQWKYYGDSVNDNNSKNGRSTSWTGVNQFYTYAKNNIGYGLCSEVDINTYYALEGDIIQVGYKDIYSHSTVVVGNIKKDNKIIDIILNSNTTDLENYPLSAYVYPNKRLIKILGWNN